MKTVGRGSDKKSFQLDPSDFVKKVPISLFQEDIPRLDEKTLALFRNILGERQKVPRLVPID
ncbi:hypothetical protein FRC07_003024 [Ceratobasidium sp. 392]|nr:hypothetical protein FRC07_003024 [Ceratobasidium sp. 392]